MTWIWMVLVPGLIAWALVNDVHRKRRARSEHVRSHSELSDKEFLERLELAENDRDAVLSARRAIAAAMGIPATTLHPADDMTYIMTFVGFDGGDWGDLAFCLEKSLGVRIPKGTWEEFAGAHEARTISTLIKFLSRKGYLQNTQAV